MKKLVALILMLMLWMTAAGAEKKLTSIQAYHRVEASYEDTKQANKSVIRLWTVETCRNDVNAELLVITEE